MKRYTSMENLKVAGKLGANVCPTKSSTDQIKKQPIEEGRDRYANFSHCYFSVLILDIIFQLIT